MKQKILMVLCVLFGLVMIIFGADKLFHFMPAMDMSKCTEEQKSFYNAFVSIKWLMPLTGLFEIIGGILIAIPKTRALGAIVILPVMVGILTHTFSYGPINAAVLMPVILGAINAWAIADNRDKYKTLIS
jgi:putative oxidoreductase